MKFTVQVEVDDETKEVTIRDSRSDEVKTFKGGLHLIAADGTLRRYYLLTFGASADLGWALAQSFNDGWANMFVKRMFFHFTEWVNKFIVNVGDGYEMNDLDDVYNRWEEEDQTKWADQDSEDVLRDKQKSEEAKKNGNKIIIH